MRLRLVTVLLLAAGCLAACASLPGPACAPGQQRLINEQLYFGTATPTGVVSAEEWSTFLADSVTARFPQGLSVWSASGQWRSADGSLTREASFVLNLLHGDDATSEGAVQAIVAEYKTRFRQEAVMRVKFNACVSF